MREAFPLVEGGGSLTLSMGATADRIPEVKLLRVECFFDAAVAAADFAEAETPKGTSSFDPALQALHDAEEAARQALRRLLESVRVRGQHWLGPDSGSPRGAARGELDDLDAARRLPVTIGLEPDLVITPVQDHQVLDSARIADAICRVQEGSRSPLEDVLRADALYLLQDADPPDYARAVLTAAIACEVKIKRTLRQRAADGAPSELVALLLENPRDWSMALLALFDGPLKIVGGVSLRESDRALYKRLDALIQRRNGLAHKEEDAPEEEEAYEHVKTARDVFQWLDAVEHGGR
jgi:hypothetical protein